MTREKAKIYAKLSREEFNEIFDGGLLNYDLICAYSKGAQIQVISPKSKEWIDDNDPEFCAKSSYRVKPGNLKDVDQWKPKIKDTYFYLSGQGTIIESEWLNEIIDKAVFKIGNCFRTRHEAELARYRMISALKDVQNEILDNKPLTDGEKELIRALRVSHIDRIYTNKNSRLFNESEDEDGYTQYENFVAIDTEIPFNVSIVAAALSEIRDEYNKELENYYNSFKQKNNQNTNEK